MTLPIDPSMLTSGAEWNVGSVDGSAGAGAAAPSGGGGSAFGSMLTDQLGKHPIESQDRAGFIVNALLIPFILSAIRMLESGFATAEDIDAGLVRGAAHPQGPLAPALDRHPALTRPAPARAAGAPRRGSARRRP